MNICPNCKTDLNGTEIPEENRHLYGDKTHFNRKIGVEVRGMYDGVLFWKCPDCNWAWDRWPKGESRLWALAQTHITRQQNTVILHEEARRFAALTPEGRADLEAFWKGGE